MAMAEESSWQHSVQSLNDELQPLMHQLVFESKVHSVLYAGTIAWLSRAFRLWQLLVSGEVRQALSAELNAAQRQLEDYASRRHTSGSAPRQGAVEPLAPRMRASRELEAFRSAREELLRESTPAEESRGLTDTPKAGPPSTLRSLQDQLHAEKRRSAVLKEQLEEQRAVAERSQTEAQGRAVAQITELSRAVEGLRREVQDHMQQKESLQQRLDVSIHQTARLKIDLSEQQTRGGEAAASALLAEERAKAAEASHAAAERLNEALATADELRGAAAASNAEATLGRLQTERIGAQLGASLTTQEVRYAAEAQRLAEADAELEVRWFRLSPHALPLCAPLHLPQALSLRFPGPLPTAPTFDLATKLELDGHCP